MLRSEVFEKLCRIFKDVFDDDSLQISEQTTQDDVPDWDSLMHITLFSEIEDKFDVRLQMKDVIKLHSVKDIVDRLMELLQCN